MGTHFIFVGEQFWGRAARASWTRKSLGRSLFLGLVSVRGERDRALFCRYGSSRLHRFRFFFPTRHQCDGRWTMRARAGFADFSPEDSQGDSVRGNGEVDGDPGLGLDGFGALEVRFEMPLLDGFLGGAGQDRRTADDAEILDRAVPADHRLQNH